VLAVLVVDFIAAKKRKRSKDFDSSLQPLAFSLRLLAGDCGAEYPDDATGCTIDGQSLDSPAA